MGLIEEGCADPNNAKPGYILVDQVNTIPSNKSIAAEAFVIWFRP